MMEDRAVLDRVIKILKAHRIDVSKTVIRKGLQLNGWHFRTPGVFYSFSLLKVKDAWCVSYQDLKAKNRVYWKEGGSRPCAWPGCTMEH